MTRITVFEDGVLRLDSGGASPGPAPGPAPGPTPTPTPIPAPGVCPPPAPGNRVVSLGGMGGLVYIEMASGLTASFPIPSPDMSHGPRMMVSVNIGETTSTAAGVILEWSISKCPGVIDPSLPSPHYNRSTVQNWNSVICIGDGMGQIDEAMARARRWAWTPTAEGPWFMTVKYTYPPAPYLCKFVYQYQNGAF